MVPKATLRNWRKFRAIFSTLGTRAITSHDLFTLVFFVFRTLPYVIEKIIHPSHHPQKTSSARLALQETCFNILKDSYASLT